MFGMKNDELRLVPHDPEWKHDFLAEQKRLAGALTDPSACIEHVGSTAIPTVHAKPILDIAVLCGDGGLEAAVSAITKLGYVFRGQFDDEVGHYYAVLDRDDVRLCQMHTFTKATADWHSKLMFRDVLRQNLELAREYDEYKLNLAKTTTDKTEYGEIKTRWVDTFILKIIAASVDVYQHS